ncbi:tyrosine-type recombinase/integrase [Vibrio sp. S11_S32]|uniref:tyrosine-type recombinase/integrase n=1 Tax=Vibrio sp. S11_S32 TaxID=2720225 RepID=UPI0016808826|nr:tyrosine-type recombinase/integrase [Vibrio sp. S11_S32]MBD1577840.1 tyrosine-type recombinase/integrase [Vibrio sp. S11_S32]
MSNALKNRKIRRVDLKRDDSDQLVKKKIKLASLPPKSKKEFFAIYDFVFDRNPSVARTFYMSALTGLRYSDCSWLMFSDFISENSNKFKPHFDVIQQKTYNMALTRLKNKHIKDNGLDSKNVDISDDIVDKLKSIAAKKAKHTVYINEEIEFLVQEIISERKWKKVPENGKDFLFANDHHHSDGLPVCTNGANQHLAKAKTHLKLDYPLGTHSFRKYFANTIISYGGDAVKLRDLLGQKSLDATTLYVNSTQEELASLIHKFQIETEV